MRIWVDADACPGAVKDMLFRAADRTGVHVILVANQLIRTPASGFVRCIVVSPGYDVADSEIVRRLSPGDLVVTSDIPLAAEVLEKGGLALNPRGERYTADGIRAKLTMRDFMETLRASGIQSAGPAAYGGRDRQAFANQLDAILAHRR